MQDATRCTTGGVDPKGREDKREARQRRPFESTTDDALPKMIEKYKYVSAQIYKEHPDDKENYSPNDDRAIGGYPIRHDTSMCRNW